MRRLYTREERLARASLRVAMVIRGMWEEKGSSDTRLLEEPMLPDELTVVGKSKAFTGRGRREHVIPRLVVIKHCHEMLEREAQEKRTAADTDAEMAKFIREHVKIVLITSEEASRLDSKDQLGWRQKMPDDWMVGHNIFHRLEAAGIEWEASPEPV